MAIAPPSSTSTRHDRRVHPAWGVAAVAFVALVGAAGFRAAPGVLVVPLHSELGWSTSLMSLAVSTDLLLLGHYAFRGVGLLALPSLLGPSVHPNMLLSVVVCGLDRVATVPPTAVLCRELFGAEGTVVFGWVVASHQLGAALAAGAAGVLREQTGSCTWAWVGGAALCAVAAVLSLSVRRVPRPSSSPA